MIPQGRPVILLVLCYLSSGFSSPFSISVVHMNDFHGRFDEVSDSGGICKPTENCVGGFSRIYKTINTILNDRADSIVLNAGDDFAGTRWYDVGKWNITQEFMNKIKFDASVVGNHEFENGVDELAEYIKALKHPMVVANMDASSQPNMQGLYTKSTIIERNGKKIGIIGVVYQSVSETSNTGNLTFLPESSSVNEEAERLVKEDGVFTNIVLSHCGYEVDKAIARNASEKISLIVGGHSHSFLYTGDNPPGPAEVVGPYPTIISSPHGHKVLIVQATSYSTYLGNITVNLDGNGEVTDWSGAPIFLETSLPQDPDVNRELEPWRAKVNAIPNPILGKTLVSLSKWRCSTEECTLGNFVTDCMVYAYSNLGNSNAWTEAAIAVADAEGLRTNMEPGDITEDDLHTAVPYKNTFDIGEIEGSKLKEVFEYNTLLENDGKIKVRLLQVSGIKLVYDLNRKYGDMIQSIKLRCQNCTIPVYEELIPSKTYRIVVDSYVAGGGRNYSVLIENLKNRTKGPLNTGIFISYLQHRNPIYEERGTRIYLQHKLTSSSSCLTQNIVLCIFVFISSKFL